MSDPQSNGNGTGPRRRRGKRFLSPSEKYEIWLSLVRGRVHDRRGGRAGRRGSLDGHEAAIGRASGRVGGVGGVQAGREGRQRPGPGAGRGQGRDRQALGGAEGDGRQVDAGRGKRALGLSGRVPRRVDAATKRALLELIDRAVADGWEHRRACAYLELGEGGRGAGASAGRRARSMTAPPGGHPVHAITPAEEQAILARVRGLSGHRPLASQARAPRQLRGRVWVSESTVRRVLAAHELGSAAPRRAGRSERQPFPEWASYERHSIWIYDTHPLRALQATPT